MQAKAEGKTVKLAGYAGADEFGDMWVRPLEPDAYGTYLKLSLEWLDTKGEASRPDRIDADTWRDAMEEMRQSWSKSLTGTSSSRGPTIGGRIWKEFKPLLKQASDDPTMFSFGPALLVKSEMQRTKPASVPKTLLTDAKARIKEMSPLSALRFELHVYRGKLTSMSLGDQ